MVLFFLLLSRRVEKCDLHSTPITLPDVTLNAKPSPPSWYDVAIQTKTDKVRKHSYDVAYQKYLPQYFEKGNIKLLEIGLGCNMNYGPGESLQLWRTYFQSIKLELHFMEYKEKCAKKIQEAYPDVTIHTGDQSNKEDLQRIIDKSGMFDVIIDDGGHTVKQQIVTIEHMFLNALAPGGIYFMEDITTSYEYLIAESARAYLDYGNMTTPAYIANIIDDMHTSWYFKSKRIPRKTPLYPELLGIDCMRGICVFQKAPAEAERTGSLRGRASLHRP
jgi:hypothetical protein